MQNKESNTVCICIYRECYIISALGSSASSWAVLSVLGVSAHAVGAPDRMRMGWGGREEIVWKDAEEKKAGSYLHQWKVNRAGAGLAVFRLLWDKPLVEQRQCLPAATLQLSSSFYAMFDL